MTSKYRSCHLEPFGMLRVNSVRDLSLNEPLPLVELRMVSTHGEVLDAPPIARLVKANLPQCAIMIEFLRCLPISL